MGNNVAKIMYFVFLAVMSTQDLHPQYQDYLVAMNLSCPRVGFEFCKKVCFFAILEGCDEKIGSVPLGFAVKSLASPISPASLPSNKNKKNPLQRWQ